MIYGQTISDGKKGWFINKRPDSFSAKFAYLWALHIFSSGIPCDKFEDRKKNEWYELHLFKLFLKWLEKPGREFQENRKNCPQN